MPLPRRVLGGIYDYDTIELSISSTSDVLCCRSSCCYSSSRAILKCVAYCCGYIVVEYHTAVSWCTTATMWCSGSGDFASSRPVCLEHCQCATLYYTSIAMIRYVRFDCCCAGAAFGAFPLNQYGSNLSKIINTSYLVLRDTAAVVLRTSINPHDQHRARPSTHGTSVFYF